jgi:hypothetical protein
MKFLGRAFSFANKPSAELLILIAIVLGALAIVPVYFTRYLPINDYPFHLARMVILAQLDNPIFARFYQQGSFLLPNVGMDAVVVPLSAILGPERATRVFVELTLVVTLFGAMALHWAAHRRLSVWPLLAVSLAHNGIFRFGFFNYLFGLGLALAAAALWLTMQAGIARSITAFIACIILIFCHMEAFGVYTLIVAGCELQNALLKWNKTRALRPIIGLFYSSVPFVLTLVLFALLSPSAKVVGEGFAYAPGLLTKPVGALFSLSSGIHWLDALTATSLACVCVWLYSTGRLTFSGALTTAFALLVVALFALPSSVMGSLYADTRLGPAIALMAILSMDIKTDAPRFAHWLVVCVALSLAFLRSAILSSLWLGYDSEMASIVTSFKDIEPGATLFSVTSEPFVRLIADSPERMAAWQPPAKHVASYAVLYAPVFVPMTFADPTKQPLVVTRAYQGIKDFQGDNPVQAPDAKALSAFIGKLHDRLESSDWPRMGPTYVLVMGRHNLEPMQLPDFATPVAKGDRFVLLKFAGRPGNAAQ